MQITFSMSVPDPIMAIQNAKAFVALLEAGVQNADGHGLGNFSFWELMSTEDEYEDGDYRDEKGNLLHIHTDHVVEAILAEKDGQKIEPNMPVFHWEHHNGKLVKVADDNHTHGHDHNED